MFSDDHMARLYERFVLSYYRTHHRDLNVNADIVTGMSYSLFVSDRAAAGNENQDITLRNGDRR